MNQIDQFNKEVRENISALGNDAALHSLTNKWLMDITPYKYAYNFKAFGRPIIQVPQDMIAIQEIIWDVRPDLIIETGIAHGGSLIMSAGFLSMLDYCDAVNNKHPLNPTDSKRRVLGVDIDIRPHNRAAIETHPLSHKIDMIQGSSIAPDIIEKVRNYARDFKTILVILDSNHTHDHVAQELKAYASLVSTGSYCVVFDTLIEEMPDDFFSDRPWGVGNNPKTAVWEYLKNHPEFKIDTAIQNKLLITVAPDGYLKRIS